MMYTGKRLLVAVVAASAAVSAQAAVSGNAAVTSDYVWRGSSQTQGEPAAQVGLRWTAGNGVYASVWGSNVSFAGSRARSEYDAVVGWSGALGENWTVDSSVTRYVYPGTARALDWTEFALTTNWKLHAWLQLAHSRDALASGQPGTYAQLGVRLPVSATLRLEASFARYWLAARYADDYRHAQLSAVQKLSPHWELRASGHHSDGAARRLFPEAAGRRWEVAVQAAF